ncbi:MAG: Rpn family recombination-promoting nuclease/putative transposase [Caldilineaceae bacterium]|nr:Rpn family recombination-promoting nuclease/putative transposase [Caldilineaceae bacterium]
MRFRLLKYMCRMGDEFFKQRPEQSELPPILPVVFYQGERAWLPSTEFADLSRRQNASRAFCPASPTTSSTNPP